MEQVQKSYKKNGDYEINAKLYKNTQMSKFLYGFMHNCDNN